MADSLSYTGLLWSRQAAGTGSRSYSEIGVELILAHALQLKAVSYAKVKTDVVDSAMLAELLRVGLIPQAHQISPGIRELREVMRVRLRLVVRRTAARVQLHSLAEKAGWPLNGKEFEELDTLEEQLETFLREGSNQAARCWLEQVRLLTRQISELEGWLHQRLIPDEQIQRLRQVPGIGVIGAYTILTETDEIARFPSPGRSWPRNWHELFGTCSIMISRTEGLRGGPHGSKPSVAPAGKPVG